MRMLRTKFIAGIPPCPDTFSGRGIVVCAGGLRHFPNLWVLLNELRVLGCHLSVEVWHFGSSEISPEMRSLLAEFDNVRLLDATEVRKIHPARILRGWELKPYSILHSAFEEVLLLDADNVPVFDPSFLFDDPKYQAAGAVFWPDVDPIKCADPAWKILGLVPRDETAVESGQLLVNKPRHWRALNLTMHLNEHSDFYYRLFYGDKESFHFAWRILNEDYAMPEQAAKQLRGKIFLQYAPSSDELLFQHRFRAKWRLKGNERFPRFRNEDRCLNHLERLDALWSGSFYQPMPPSSDADQQIMDAIVGQRVFKLFDSVGGLQQIELLADHSLVPSILRYSGWHVAQGNLVLGRRDGSHSALQPDPNFRGGWVSSTDSSAALNLRVIPFQESDARLEKAIHHKCRYKLARNGSPPMPMVLLPDGTIGPGATSDTLAWITAGGCLHFLGRDGITASLRSSGSRFLGQSRNATDGPLELVPDNERRHYAIFGLQRTCTNLVQHFFRHDVGAPRRIRFGQQRPWKHSWIPTSDYTEDVFVIVCVRHPMDWLVACYDYFVREHGKDNTICSHFSPEWSFEQFVRSSHYEWKSPIDRWNTMYRHYLSRLADLGINGFLVKAELLQSPHLQAQTFQSLLIRYDPFLNLDARGAVVSQEMTNICTKTDRPMNSLKYWQRSFLDRYNSDLLSYTRSSLHGTLTQQMGYDL